jgi:hypothetical protein
MIEQSKRPDATIIENDGSEKQAAQINDGQDPTNTDNSGAGTRTKAETDNTEIVSTANSKKSNTGTLIFAGLGLGALALIGLSSSKKTKEKNLNGLGFAAKKESKKLKKNLARKGIKLPHGYKTEKRKKKVKPVNI